METRLFYLENYIIVPLIEQFRGQVRLQLKYFCCFNIYFIILLYFPVRPRPNTPTSPAVSPTTPTKSLPGEDPEDMIPETRTPPLLSDDGLIAPRKPVNPVREDPGRQNLHRELLFNQKM